MDERNGLLETLFGQMPMGIVVLDRDLVVQRYNKTWQQIVSRYGPSPAEEDLVGQALFDLLPGSEKVLKPRLKKAFSGQSVRDEMLHLRIGGVDGYWDFALHPQKQDGRIGQILLVVVDMTEGIEAKQHTERRIADRTRKLSALYEVMEVASEPLDLETMLNRILERMLAAVRSQAGAIYLLDERSNSLELIAHQGLTSELAKLVATTPADSGLPGAVVHHGSPIVVPDMRSDPRTRETMRQARWQAYAGLPMRAGGRLLGVLSVFRASDRPFGVEDVALLDSVADQIGAAVENSRLRQKAEQLAVAEERARLARELHDAVTQSLYSMSLLATAGLRLLEPEANPELKDSPELLAETLTELQDTSQRALKEMRLLLYRLRPLALQGNNLIGAVRQRLDAVERRAGIDSQLIVEDFGPLPPPAEEAFYAIAQEALNNALRHSKATAVVVGLSRQSDDMVLAVTDNGRGFRTEALGDHGGMGLATMQERVGRLGGTLSIRSSPGKGTTIEARIPM